MKKLAKNKLTSKQEKRLKKKALKISVVEGSAYSVMDGFGLRYVTPYALALGASNVVVGYLSSLPSLIGNLSQLFSMSIMKRFSRQKMVAVGTFLQASMWLVMLLVGVLYFNFNSGVQTAGILLIAAYTLFTIFGALVGPIWSSWMKDLLTENRGKYFGIRSRICGVVVIISMLVAGYLLDLFKNIGLLFAGFVILFVVAFFARSASSYLFTRQYEPRFKFDDSRYFSFLDFIKKMYFNNFGRFVIFTAAIYFATAISGPFFTVYMLNDLKFNYVIFTLISLSSSISSLVFMPAWGRFIDKYGNLKVMKITGFLVGFVPLLWLASIFVFHHAPSMVVPYLFTIELFSGLVWAGFGLASGTFIYEAVTSQRMAICVAYFNIINNVGVFVGALIGGYISSTGLSIFGLQHILLIFLISGIVRFAVYFLMISKVKEVRPVKAFGLRQALRNLASASIPQVIKLLR